MSVEQLESQVLALPLAQRRAFTRRLDEHRDEIEQRSVLDRAQESEIRQRFAEMEAGPAMRIPFAEADAERMFREFADARTHKTPSRLGCAMKKKWLIILSLLLLAAPAALEAQDYGYTDDYYWDAFPYGEYPNQIVIITEYNGPGAAVVIPSSINNWQVFGIGSDLNYGGYPSYVFPNGVTSVTIPDSVTFIGFDAFEFCRSLTSVTIPGSVTYIWDEAFADCTNLTTITISDGVT